ncbi:ankyrin repeat domain-containing protein [Sphingomonas sp. BIUV-7]|uniref:Ankyrin repeat domain-containing protein n=1 Tax=Sphingomonas natans TaxID=3063330 RepID=A0ABT8YCD3_9SPHN|nr:ankyrin repeat domain-containing protein [Sphingomonas sp. BIUV-7]MDO6415990.1 ankyrin repeat domain-containing protein [Sphingomonas sp. BIUV-7]
MGVRNRFAMIAAGAIGLALAMPASAQFSDSFSFLKAVKDRDGDKAMPLINKPGAPVLNTRDPNTGETALHIVTRAHDMTWLGFLLGRGASTEIKDKQGMTPLLAAAQTGDADATRLLLSAGANANAIDNSGETSLIFAVRNRDLAVGRLLMTAGANPDARDTIAGKSARDYATEDRRGTAMLKLLDEAKPAKAANGKISGPVR